MSETITFMDSFTIEQFSKNLKELRNAVKKQVALVVDLSNVDKIDVAAMQVLIAAKKECEKNGHKISFKKSNSVENKLSLVGIKL